MQQAVTRLRKLKQDLADNDAAYTSEFNRLSKLTPIDMTRLTKQFIRANNLQPVLNRFRSTQDRRRYLESIRPSKDQLIEQARLNHAYTWLGLTLEIDNLEEEIRVMGIPQEIRDNVGEMLVFDTDAFVEPKEKANRNVYVFTMQDPSEGIDDNPQWDEYKQKMTRELPTNYPYFIQSTYKLMIYRRPDGGIGSYGVETRRERYAAKISNDDDRRRYINGTFDNLFEYTFITQPSPIGSAYIQSVEFNIYRATGNKRVIKVRRAYMGNCFVNIVAGSGSSEYLYEKLERLRPTEDNKNPEVDHDDVYIISKTLGVKVSVYTKLGAILHKPWHQFNEESHGNHYHVVFSDGHANIMSGKIKVDSIEYVNRLDDPMNYTDVVNTNYSTNNELLYYIRYTDNKMNMYKKLRPSTITGNEDHDNDPKFHYLSTPLQVVAKIFRDRHLSKIVDENIKNVTKAAEHFVSRKIFHEITDNTKCIDANKCFISYKTNKYYKGFPLNDLYPTKNVEPNTQFVVCNIVNPPQAFKLLLAYESGTIVLPCPVYKWLLDMGATVTVLYTLAGKVQDIDVIKFADEFKDKVCEDDLKQFRNKLIGTTICGGMKETKKLICYYDDEDELQQIIQECEDHKLSFGTDEVNGKKLVRIDYKAETNGAFHFHSFILGYALIHVGGMMQRMINNGNKIVGFNVDSILYEGTDPEYCTDAFGGWKEEELNTGRKSYLFATTVKPHEPLEYKFEFVPPTPERIPSNMVLIGAPGVSKSYPYLNDPHYDQIILTYTRRLKNKHRETANLLNKDIQIETAAKYFQFSMIEEGEEEKFNMRRNTGKIPRRRKVIIVDEFTMFSQSQWDNMFNRATKDESVIIALGDHCQIANAIQGTAITEKFFTAKQFSIVNKPRLESESENHRHSFADGIVFDSLRGLDPFEQVKQAKKFLKTINIVDMPINDKSIFITDRNKTATKVNVVAREWFKANKKPFPVKNRKGDIRYVDLEEKVTVGDTKPTNEKLIWWGKMRMGEIPEGFRYEPCYAVTSDSIQGETLGIHVYVDTNIKRHGAFYTAITRTRTDRVNNISAMASVTLVDDTRDYDKQLRLRDMYINGKKKLIEMPYPDHITLKNKTKIIPKMYSTLEEAQADNVIKYSKFIVHTEYPHRYFLVFDSVDDFAEYMGAQPMAQRCYHEVCTTEYRKFVVDIDGTSKKDGLKTHCIMTFIKEFNERYPTAFVDPMEIHSEMILIDSSGISKTTGKYKFSLQIRLPHYASTCEDMLKFAEILNESIGGNMVDLGVYKSTQNFRIVGCTKLGDGRNSKANGWPVYNTLVSVGVDDCVTLAKYIPKDKTKEIEKLDVKGFDLLQAAKPYTEGLNHIERQGRHYFNRYAPSYCQMCNVIHDSDGMYAKKHADGIYLHCWCATHKVPGRVSTPIKIM